MVRHIASHTSMKESGPGGVCADTPHRRTPRPQCRKVVALLHGQRGLAQVGKDAAEVVGDVAHDEAVEQRHPPIGARVGQDAPGRDKPEIPQRVIELCFPMLGSGFDGRQGFGDAPPSVLDREIDRRSVQVFQAVFRGLPRGRAREHGRPGAAGRRERSDEPCDRPRPGGPSRRS